MRGRAGAFSARAGRYLVRPKQPWRRYSVKAGLLFLSMSMAWMYVVSRYRIGIDNQVEKCLPGYTFFLVDKWDHKLERGKIYSFHARHMEPLFKDGTRMVKILRGLPGDSVEIDRDLRIRINSQEIAQGLPLAQKLGASESAFQGKTTLAHNTYWFMGESPMSFDSRYWGVVAQEQIIGRAYPLF